MTDVFTPPADEPRHPDAGILEVHYRQSHRVDMPQEFYDTLASLCELVGLKRRQEFDALLSKFVDHISAVVNPPDEPTAVAALRELVACKDLKQKWESAEADFQVPAEVWTAIREEYKRRQPLAWEAARRVLEAPRAIPASTPGQSETLTDEWLDAFALEILQLPDEDRRDRLRAACLHTKQLWNISGTHGHCKACGTHEVSRQQTCHNSACVAYAKDVTFYEGWRALEPHPAPDEPTARQSPGDVHPADEGAVMALVDDYTDHFADVRVSGGPTLADGFVLKAKKDAIRRALAPRAIPASTPGDRA